MQTITVAISPEGINYLFSKLLGGQIAQALTTHLAAPPTQTFNPSDFTVANGDKNTGISVNLSNGKFKIFNPTFGGWEQGKGDGSLFTVTMNTGKVEADYAWSESYTETDWVWGGLHSPSHWGKPQPGSGRGQGRACSTVMRQDGTRDGRPPNRGRGRRPGNKHAFRLRAAVGLLRVEAPTAARAVGGEAGRATSPIAGTRDTASSPSHAIMRAMAAAP